MKHFYPDENPQPVFVYSVYFKAGTMRWHEHRQAQLVYVSEGALTVRTTQGIWVVPPQRAVWIPPHVRHSTYSSRPYRLCTLYIEPELVELPTKCTVVAIEPLVHELLLAAAQFGPKYDEGSAEQRLLRVILDRLPTLSLPPLHLPEPEDDRLRRITERLLKEPSKRHSLSVLAHSTGLTERTAERLFRSETGMTFGKWRQQLRLITALQKLADGESVTNVALDVGYSDVSAFIAMFKTVLGITPARYFRQINKHSKLTTDLLQSPENIPTLDDNNVSVAEGAITRHRQREVALPDEPVLGTQ